MRLPQARLDQVLARFQEVEARMSAASDGAEVVRLGKEYAELKPVADAAERLIKAQGQRAELEALVAGDDAEMAELAKEELGQLDETEPALGRDRQADAERTGRCGSRRRRPQIELQVAGRGKRAAVEQRQHLVHSRPRIGRSPGVCNRRAA